MADVDFGERIDPQSIVQKLQAEHDALQRSVTKKSSFLGTLTTISEKNAELFKKVDTTKQELGAILIEIRDKSQRFYANQYRDFLQAEIDRLNAVENKPT